MTSKILAGGILGIRLVGMLGAMLAVIMLAVSVALCRYHRLMLVEGSL